MADAIGVSRQQVSRWENGSAMPTGENLTALAEVLGVSAEWILRGDDPREDQGRGREVNPPPMPNHPENGTSPAEQLLEFLSQRLGHRRVAGELTDKDLIAAAYTLARKHGFTAKDYEILDDWRDQIIQGEKG